MNLDYCFRINGAVMTGICGYWCNGSVDELFLHVPINPHRLIDRSIEWLTDWSIDWFLSSSSEKQTSSESAKFSDDEKSRFVTVLMPDFHIFYNRNRKAVEAKQWSRKLNVGTDQATFRSDKPTRLPSQGKTVIAALQPDIKLTTLTSPEDEQPINDTTNNLVRDKTRPKHDQRPQARRDLFGAGPFTSTTTETPLMSKNQPGKNNNVIKRKRSTEFIPDTPPPPPIRPLQTNTCKVCERVRMSQWKSGKRWKLSLYW